VYQSSFWRLQEFRHQGKQMTKEELIQMLRGVGCDENTVTAMSNA
jgi:DNA-binding transcriptional regulator PaaX